MHFTLTPITHADARAISNWRYEDPYSVYNGTPSSVAALLEPRYLYHSVHDGRGELVGYFCYGEDARVSVGKRLGLYEHEDALDIGLGMRPDLTGQGHGEEFVNAGLRHARSTYSPRAFRLTVATFNRRAISVYRQAGFERVETFGATRPNGEKEWLLMRRDSC